MAKMEFRRPPSIDIDESRKSSGMWAFLRDGWKLIAWATFVILFMQLHGFIRSAVAASLALFGLLLMLDLFRNHDSHATPTDFFVDPDIGQMVFGIVVFLVTWISCTINYGFLFGFGLGWLPAYILAQILMLIWRVTSIAVVSVLLAFAGWAN